MGPRDHDPLEPDLKQSSRRHFLLGGAVAGAGAVLAVGADQLINPATASPSPPEPGEDDGTDAGTSVLQLHGQEVVPFYGAHQAGIATPAQAHVTYLGLDLLPPVDVVDLRRLMRILSDDSARLTQGVPALADSEPELALLPAGLTITFAFGPGFVHRIGSGAQTPEWVRPLPDFSIDQLQPEFSDGDLIIQVGAEDPLSVAHAVRVLLKNARRFTSVRWVQQGFRRAYGSERPGTTMRNLFGQVDGTSNPVPGTPQFDETVWIPDGPWKGGTGLVIRRIHLDMEGWDELGRIGREESIGRTLSNGAPLTGEAEFDEPDFEATTPLGFPVIGPSAHIRRAAPPADDPRQVFFRRGYNYDLAPAGSQISDSGMIFVTFQADVDAQFVPVQQRLADDDLLNEWTIPIGSSVAIVPPGCEEGGFIGEQVLA